MYRIVLLLSLPFLSVLPQTVAGQDPASYRRYLECEDMTAEGVGLSVRSHETSSGGRVMQCSIRDEQAAKSHHLVANLERTLPPRRYAVEVTGRVLGETQGEPLEVEVRLGETAAVTDLPRTTRTSCLATIDVKHPFRTMAIALRTPHTRIWFDRVFLTGDLADVHYDSVSKTQTIDDWTLRPAGRIERRLELPLDRTGVFRLLMRGKALTSEGDVELPRQEYTFCVLPEPPRQMKHTFGAYLSLVPDAVQISSRAGIRRTVTLSSGNGLLEDWSEIEPEQGRFVWWDDRVKLARKYDVDIVANLPIKSERDIPAWARRSVSDPDVLVSKHAARSRTAWQNFVFELVSHYGSDIRDWLIVDEPYTSFSPQQYVELLKVTYEAAKRADPDCRVLAHGGYYDHWLPGVVEAGGLPYFDGISDYARTHAQGDRLKQFAAQHGKFILTVEYGPHRSLYAQLKHRASRDEAACRRPGARHHGQLDPRRCGAGPILGRHDLRDGSELVVGTDAHGVGEGADETAGSD